MSQLEVTLPTKEQIEKRAYELYLARGCEPGMDVADWLAAEKELTLENELIEPIRLTQKKVTIRAVAGEASTA